LVPPPSAPRHCQGNHLTHAIELPWISGISMLGLRGLSRGAGETAAQVNARHIDTISATQVIQLGPAATVARIPAADGYYVTIDIDVLDPSVAPATGTPVPGGLSYYQLCDVLTAIAAKGRVVGFDIMEVSPPYDANNRTSQVAAFVTARFLGAVFKNRK
jgi:agmatinase